MTQFPATPGDRPPVAGTQNLGHERARDPRLGRDGSTDDSHPTSDAIGSRRDGRAPEPLGCQVGRAATAGAGEDLPADPDSNSVRRQSVGERRGGCSPELGLTGVEWGVYGPAIHRWERALGRVAPSPTASGRRGGQQLAPQFVEWMMGLPVGHVTNVPGLSRNEMLKILGNGCVPQQATEAVRWLIARQEANI